jgi:hypothetical protein
MGPPPSSAVVNLRPAVRDGDAHRRAIRAFARTAGLASAVDLDAFLRRLAAELCALVDVPRCSVYLRDDETGLYRGQVGHGADDRLVKRLTCGLLADRFTREIVETRTPVVLEDAMRDPRAIVSTMRAWGVSRVMGVPMVAGDEVIGIFFLDSRDRAHTFTAADEDVAFAFAELAAGGVAEARVSAELRSSVAAMAGRNAALRRVAAVDERLTAILLDGGGLDDLAAALAELTSHVCVICGADHEPLAAGAPRRAESGGDPPDLAAVLGDHELDPGRPATIEPVPEAGLHRRMLAAAVIVGGRRCGTLALIEHSRRFSRLEALVIRRAAGIVGLELSAAKRAAAATLDLRAALAGALVRGDDEPAELERRAALAGVRLDAPHVACHLVPLAGTPVPAAAAVAEALAGQAPELDVLAARTDGDVAVLLEVPPDGVAAAASLIAEVCRERHLLAGVSSPCARADAYPRAYEEARQCARCLEAFESAERVLTAEELGPTRVFLASCDVAEAVSFAGEVLAPLDGSAELVETLDVFLREAASARRTAAALGVHHNTVRYRLARIERLTGSPVATDAEAQLRMRLALAVRRVRGR